MPWFMGGPGMAQHMSVLPSTMPSPPGAIRALSYSPLCASVRRHTILGMRPMLRHRPPLSSSRASGARQETARKACTGGRAEQGPCAAREPADSSLPLCLDDQTQCVDGLPCERRAPEAGASGNTSAATTWSLTHSPAYVLVRWEDVRARAFC